jgi:hypothetical protein
MTSGSKEVALLRGAMEKWFDTGWPAACNWCTKVACTAHPTEDGMIQGLPPLLPSTEGCRILPHSLLI